MKDGETNLAGARRALCLLCLTAAVSGCAGVSRNMPVAAEPGTPAASPETAVTTRASAAAPVREPDIATLYRDSKVYYRDREPAQYQPDTRRLYPDSADNPDPALQSAISKALAGTEFSFPPVETRTPEKPVAPAATVDETDAWQRLRSGFGLPELDGKYVEYYERWYAERPDYLARIAARAQVYLPYILPRIEEQNLPTEIALLPIVESSYRPRAYSRSHASGLWQFIPATGRRFGLKQNWWYDGRRDVVRSTEAAIAYLSELGERFDHDWFLALASYNAGEANIERAMKASLRAGRSDDYPSLRLKSETQRYVPKLVAIRNIVRDPEKFGLILPRLTTRDYFRRIELPGQIDLNIAADLIGISSEQLRDLNPAFKRWATDPDGPHELLIPVDHEQQFEAALAQLPPRSRLRWTRYRIKPGDTLSQIAARYDVSIDALRRANSLKGNSIRAGRDLRIPLAMEMPQPVKLASTGQSAKYHRVRKGDTLWGISQRYRINLSRLARWNEINKNSTLRLGQQIRLFAN